jgi:hypothetical protein
MLIEESSFARNRAWRVIVVVGDNNKEGDELGLFVRCCNMLTLPTLMEALGFR